MYKHKHFILFSSFFGGGGGNYVNLNAHIWNNSPGTSISLSELEPLLSEEDPVFLEVAMGSIVLSTTKQYTCSYIS